MISLRYLFVVLFTLFLLFGCGRSDIGCLVNATKDTLVVTLKSNPLTRSSRNYRVYDKASIISHDSVSEIEIIQLKPQQVIFLGSFAAGDGSRSDYRTWEFSEISVKGPNVQIDAKGDEIMKYVKTKSSYEYDFVIEKE